MLGVGSTELLIIIVIVLMLFGPTLFAFWLGYTVGKKRTPGARPSAPALDSAAQPPVELPGPSESSHGGRIEGDDTQTDPDAEERVQ